MPDEYKSYKLLLSLALGRKMWYTKQENESMGDNQMLDLEQARQRVQELRTVIEKNNRLYYDQDAPELEDFEARCPDPGAERTGRQPTRN